MATPIPTNVARFELASILSATAGSILSRGAFGESSGDAIGVGTDTRALGAGSIFVALRGDKHDGHAHLSAAEAAGASVAIVESAVAAPARMTTVRVASTLDALGALARAHVRRWRKSAANRRVIAITGSAGKTTTRVAVSALLEALRAGEVHATTGNLNNRVGLPMVAFGLTEEHRYAVLEAGMNQRGEIAALASICEPDVAVVTLVAAAHTEYVGTIDDVALEKGALVRALGADGVAVGNADDARVRHLVERSPSKRRVLYGRAEDAAVKILAREVVGLEAARLRFATRHGELEFTTPLLGEAGALASAAALAVAIEALDERVDSALAERAFAAADVGGGGGRLVPRVFVDGLAVIDDSYNANPASSCASIRAAAEIAKATSRRLILILGEMRELGAESRAGHALVGEAAAASGAAHLIAVGGDANLIAERAAEHGLSARFFASTDDAIATALPLVRPTDLVLVKGSRGVATEKLVAALRDLHDAPMTTKTRPAPGVKERP